MKQNALTHCKRNPSMAVPYLLMASYLYYIRDISPPLLDCEFDELCVFALKNWKEIKHRHKHLIHEADLKAGSLFMLADLHYPDMVKSAAFSWLAGVAPPPETESLFRISRALERVIWKGQIQARMTPLPHAPPFNPERGPHAH